MFEEFDKKSILFLFLIDYKFVLCLVSRENIGPSFTVFGLIVFLFLLVVFWTFCFYWIYWLLYLGCVLLVCVCWNFVFPILIEIVVVFISFFFVSSFVILIFDFFFLCFAFLCLVIFYGFFFRFANEMQTCTCKA